LKPLPAGAAEARFGYISWPKIRNDGVLTVPGVKAGCVVEWVPHAERRFVPAPHFILSNFAPRPHFPLAIALAGENFGSQRARHHVACRRADDPCLAGTDS